MSTPDAHEPHPLLRSLFVELFQTEESAAVHCAREADRLKDTPPGEAFRAIAEHARVRMADIEALARERKMPEAKSGTAIGRVFSDTREAIADRVLSSERSYRMTLLGTRHGLDLVHLVEHVARQQNDTGLEQFCMAWLRERDPLVRRAHAQLRWFAEHPEEASTTSTDGKPIPFLANLLGPR